MSDDRSGAAPVLQMRLVVEAEDYDEAVHFFRDVLGLPEEMAIAGGEGAHVTILQAGRATLELANPAQKRMIDEVEVGRQVAPRMRRVRGHRRGGHDRHAGRCRRRAGRPTDRDAVAFPQLPPERPGQPPDHAVPGARSRRRGLTTADLASCSPGEH